MLTNPVNIPALDPIGPGIKNLFIHRAPLGTPCGGMRMNSSSTRVSPKSQHTRSTAMGFADLTQGVRVVELFEGLGQAGYE